MLRRFLKYFAIFTGKHLCRSLLNKVVGLKGCNFIRNRLQHRCFSVNTAKFKGMVFLAEHFWWLKVMFTKSRSSLKNIEIHIGKTKKPDMMLRPLC